MTRTGVSLLMCKWRDKKGLPRSVALRHLAGQQPRRQVSSGLKQDLARLLERNGDGRNAMSHKEPQFVLGERLRIDDHIMLGC